MTEKVYYKPWDYNLTEYPLTSRVYNSKNTLEKIARWSGVGIAVVAVAETVYKIVTTVFKFIGNLFGIYNLSIFQHKEESPAIKEENVQPPKTGILSKIKNLPTNLPHISKKTLLTGLSIIGSIGIAYSVYSYFATPTQSTISAIVNYAKSWYDAADRCSLWSCSNS